MSDDDIEPSGNIAFDRAREYLNRFREDEALDWFEIAVSEGDDRAVPRVGRGVCRRLVVFARPSVGSPGLGRCRTEQQ